MKRTMLFLVLVPSICAVFSHDAHSEPLKVYFAGFAYGGNYGDAGATFPFTSKLLSEKNSGQSVMERALASQVSKVQNPNLSIIVDQLGNYKTGEAVSMAFVVDWENVSTERYGGEIKVVIDIHAQILVYDFTEKKVICSYPVAVQYIDIRRGEYSPERTIDQIRYNIYSGGGPVDIFKRFSEKLSSLNIKQKYSNKVQVVSFLIDDNARSALNSANVNEQLFSTFSANEFSKFLSTNQSVAVLPYSQGHAVGGKMTARFSNGESIDLTLPEPDFSIDLALREFRKVKLASNPVETAWAYASFIQVKVKEPYGEDVKMDARVKYAVVKHVPEGQSSIDDWTAYQESLMTLFDQFTKQVTKRDSEWIEKWTKGENILEGFEKFSGVLDGCR